MANNYAVPGKPFNFRGTFRVLRTEGFRSELPDYPQVEESGISINTDELKELVAKARSLRFIDYGNGIAGLFAECPEFNFCVVAQHEGSARTETKQELRSENSINEDDF